MLEEQKNIGPENKHLKVKPPGRLPGRFAAALKTGEFAVTAELGPSRGVDPEAVMKKATLLKHHVHAINITDNAAACVKMSPLAAACLTVLAGGEPIMQLTCRDRNRLALQSDLLGAAALGVKNICCLSGDHSQMGDHPEAKPVYDIDSIHLLQIARKMRDEAKFASGDPIRTKAKGPDQPPDFLIGAVANPFGDPLAARVVRMAKKIKAGAEFIQTQCVFHIGRFEQWYELIDKRGFLDEVSVLPGIMPIRSPRALQYMAESVPGMRVDKTYLKRMEEAEDKKEEGIKITLEIIKKLREFPKIAGIHIMTVEWESIIPRIVEEAGLLPAAPQTETAHDMAG